MQIELVFLLGIEVEAYFPKFAPNIIKYTRCINISLSKIHIFSFLIISFSRPRKCTKTNTPLIISARCDKSNLDSNKNRVDNGKHLPYIYKTNTFV